MKLKYFYLVPLLTINSCATSKVYENVNYKFDYDTMKYVVNVMDKNKSKEYEVDVDHYYIVYVSNYKYSKTTNDFIINEFYVSGTKLYVYKRI